MKILISDLRKKVITKLLNTYDKEDSEMIADVMMSAELSGKLSHGIVRLVSGYYDTVDSKRSGKPEVKQLSLNTALVNGNFNSAMLVLSVATNEALRLAETAPVVIVGTNNTSSTAGMISYYLNKIADAGYIGIVMARAKSSVAGFGSKEPIFGTNPIGFAFPGKDKFIFDMSTSAITYGGLMKAKVLGEEIPEGIAYDKNGNPTTDPDAAMEGSTLTFDKGYKGAGLAMVVEILAGIFVGSGFGQGINNDEWGNLIIVIKPDIFILKDDFSKKLSEYITFIKSKNANQRLPGENSQKLYNVNINNGYVFVDDKLLEKLS